VAKLEAHKAGLSSHMHNVEDCCAQLMEQLKALKEKWCATCVENVKLYKKIFELRKALNPGEDMVSKEKEKKRKEKKTPCMLVSCCCCATQAPAVQAQTSDRTCVSKL